MFADMAKQFKFTNDSHLFIKSQLSGGRFVYNPIYDWSALSAVFNWILSTTFVENTLKKSIKKHSTQQKPPSSLMFKTHLISGLIASFSQKSWLNTLFLPEFIVVWVFLNAQNVVIKLKNSARLTITQADLWSNLCENRKCTHSHSIYCSLWLLS